MTIIIIIKIRRYFEVNNFRKFFAQRNFAYTEISYTRSEENVPDDVLNTTSGHYQHCITGSSVPRATYSKYYQDGT